MSILQCIKADVFDAQNHKAFNKTNNTDTGQKTDLQQILLKI